MNSNQIKSINGYNSKKTLLQQLQELQEDGVITCCTSDFRNGYKDFDLNQFFAPFYIEFKNGEGWLIFASTSIRNDRMNNQQWNSLHLRQICTNVKKAYLIMPDEIIDNKKELSAAKSYNNKIFSHKMYTTIDAVLLQSQLVEAIVSYSKQLSKYHTEDDDSISQTNDPQVVYGHSISDLK